MHPIASERIRMHPNGSEHLRKPPTTSEIIKISVKSSENFAKTSRSRVVTSQSRHYPPTPWGPVCETNFFDSCIGCLPGTLRGTACMFPPPPSLPPMLGSWGSTIGNCDPQSGIAQNLARGRWNGGATKLHCYSVLTCQACARMCIHAFFD